MAARFDVLIVIVMSAAASLGFEALFRHNDCGGPAFPVVATGVAVVAVGRRLAPLVRGPAMRCPSRCCAPYAAQKGANTFV